MPDAVIHIDKTLSDFAHMILNLTQHQATVEQITLGVVEPEVTDKKTICSLLTFEEVPSKGELESRAKALVAFVTKMGCCKAMVGGAPYFMSYLERALKEKGYTPVYAFSKRESVDQVQQDGSIRKVAVFRHAGWVEC